MLEMARHPERSEVFERHKARELHPLQGRLPQGPNLLGRWHRQQHSAMLWVALHSIVG